MSGEVNRDGEVGRFDHLDALVERKRNRPGVVDLSLGHQMTVFYGSRDKLGRYPADAIVVDSHAEPGSEARGLAEYLEGFVETCTYFHGSMQSETVDERFERRCARRLPNEHLDELRFQAQGNLFDFHAVWQRLSWLEPGKRARLLEAIWWGREWSPVEEMVLSLVVADGWDLADVAAFSPDKLNPRAALVQIDGRTLRLTARTAALAHRVSSLGDVDWPVDRVEVVGLLRGLWERLEAGDWDETPFSNG